jgi:hypothetical protein
MSREAAIKVTQWLTVLVTQQPDAKTLPEKSREEWIRIASDAAGCPVSWRSLIIVANSLGYDLRVPGRKPSTGSPNRKGSDGIARVVSLAKVIRSVCRKLSDELQMDLSQEINALTVIVSRRIPDLTEAVPVSSRSPGGNDASPGA